MLFKVSVVDQDTTYVFRYNFEVSSSDKRIAEDTFALIHD